MYLSQRLRHLAVIDPTVIERERQCITADQRRRRLLDRLDRAAAKLARLEATPPERTLRPSRTRRQILAARLSLATITAAAQRAGLVTSH